MDLPGRPDLPAGRGLPGRADVSVRPATAADAPELARVQLVTWRTAYRAVLPPEVLDDWDDEAAAGAWRTAVVAPPTPGHGVLVALDGGTVAGFAAHGPAEQTADEEPFRGGPTSELVTLLVEPRWGRRGHGSRLLAAVVDLTSAAGAARLQMWVPEADEVTSRFLTAAGWAPDGWVRTLDTGGTPLRQTRWHTILDDERGAQ
ncbi:GNAT family N-acetyltransferase [Modestobacter italicus]|uniref:GNAT family N-acetyltransferase n=1 Tax=Modestobacter italicus (strain DSM 44449 / CECT 9708 / BC 501) TaxID=2732864 RepID=UPI001C94899E|nr:GNAT family N-acetyltransferase [Modestobacter italicus]